MGNGAFHSVLDLPIHMIAAYVWWFFTRESDETERTKFEARLWQPPKEQRNKPIPKKSPWSAENEMKGFSALKAETGA